MSEYYGDQQFRHLVSACLEQTRKVLHNEKRLTSLDTVAHKYNDKFLITEYLVKAAVACFMNCLSSLGLSEKDLSVLLAWSECLDVTLRLEIDQNCVFVKEVKRDVEDATRFQTEVAGFSLTTSKLITTVTEYFYLFTARYELVAYRGVGDSATDRIVLQSRSSEQSIVTSSKTSPYPGATNTHSELNISWLLRRIDPQSTRATFSIDRDRDDCHTPTRNEEVSSGLAFFMQSAEWCINVREQFMNKLFEVQHIYSLSHVRQDMTSIETFDDVFHPVWPLVSEVSSDFTPQSMAQSQSEIEPESKVMTISNEVPDASSKCAETIDGGISSIISCSATMTLTDQVVNQLLSEQMRSLQIKLDSLTSLFPPSTPSPSGKSGTSDGKAIVSVAEAKLLAILAHMIHVSIHFNWSIHSIENMLRDQLVAAVGKTLQASDFTAYMRYHNRKLFKEEFQPRPFSHAVRRTAQHSPEGSIRIEEHAYNAVSEPIHTACCSRSASGAAPMQFALNASTNVTFGGDRHLHTWLNHSFSGQALPNLKLVAQARQFSSFIVLVGRIVSAHVFEPKYGMIVQNKDEITIPLDLEQIPTPKQFRDAIESLSPEQQRFAKAFRGMQLESTLFGVLVLQIKPQLEMVLKLSTDILTKEIRLTQDIMEMFIKYQIPSDLLSFDEVSQPRNTPTCRLNAVKEHIEGMRSMISASKSQELEEERLKQVYRHGQEAILLQNDNKLDEINDGLREERSVGSMAMHSFAAPVEFMAMTRRQSTLSRMASGLQLDIFSKPAPKEERHMNASMISRMLPATSPPLPPAPYAAVAVPAPGGIMQPVVVAAAAVTGKIDSSPGEQPNEKNRVSDQEKKSKTKSSSTTEINDRRGDTTVTVPDLTVSEIMDYTKYPTLLDRRYEELDSDSVLRPTIINPGSVWSKKSFKSLMSEAETKSLHTDDQVSEKNAAFDLLDALSKSGALVMHSASLHVVIAATHCFDETLMATVVQGNVNPIERVERSALIMASTIHELPACDLISDNERSRVLTYSPQLAERICG
jgi:hypothetical protein